MSPSTRSVALGLLLMSLLSFVAVGTASGRSPASVQVALGTRAVPQAARATQTISASPFGADIGFRTTEPTTGRVAYGLGEPTVWTAVSGPATEHRVHLSGLRPGRTYKAVIDVVSADGRVGSTEVLVRTRPLPRSAAAGIAGGALTLDGEPFFPIFAFGQCDTFDQSLDRGVNTFLLGGCRNENEAAEARELAGSALVAASTHWAASDVPGQIGHAYPDEADEHGGTYESLPVLPSWQQSGKVSFLTLTNHFYSNADPLPQGKAMYPGLARRADVLGFDLYPMQVWCRRSAFQHVYLAQRELDALVKGRPTYQWIETRRMQCPQKGLAPTGTTLTAETWLAIAGGADGIGWFPWNPTTRSVSIAMRGLGEEIAALQPALLAPELAAGATSGSGVYVGARQLNGAIYVIAVNASRGPVSTSISVSGLGSRSLRALFEPERVVTSSGGRFVDTFAPLQAHVYVSAPPLAAG